jgi:hypothetical protein
MSFAFLAVVVALLFMAGLTPSTWTVSIMIAASLLIAYMTKPEGEK